MLRTHNWHLGGEVGVGFPMNPTELSEVEGLSPLELPSASLIIPTRDRPQLLRETIASVLRGNDIPTEIIIVDQSDPPYTDLADLDYGSVCTVQHVCAAAKGLSFGKNVGIAAARHNVIAVIDDDMTATPTWFGSLIRALLAAGERAVVTGAVLVSGPEAVGSFAPPGVVGETAAIYTGRIGTDVLAGGHMAAYRSAFTEVGSFDERFGAGALFASAEDNDFGFRLLEAGYRIVYEPGAILYHRAWRPAGEYFRLRWRYGRGKGGFYSKYLSLRDHYMLRRMLWDIVHRIVRFPYQVWRDPRRTFGDIPYVVGIISGSVEWFLTQQRMR
jgi:glycosyltransferase involved in cell wall biosynthesis